jgi:diaminopimelate decarboxylase
MDRSREEQLLSIAREFGTPVYVYDAEVLRRQLLSLKAFDRVRFAQKACGNLHLQRLLRSEGALVDCVSLGELDRVCRWASSTGRWRPAFSWARRLRRSCTRPTF